MNVVSRANNQELRNILIKELGIGELPVEAQEEIIEKLGDVILKSLTVSIFDKLPNASRTEFEKISEKGDNDMIQEFLEKEIPDLHELMEEEVKKTLQKFAEREQGGTEEPKARGEE